MKAGVCVTCQLERGGLDGRVMGQGEGQSSRQAKGAWDSSISRNRGGPPLPILWRLEDRLVARRLI